MVLKTVLAKEKKSIRRKLHERDEVRAGLGKNVPRLGKTRGISREGSIHFALSTDFVLRKCDWRSRLHS